MWPDIFFLPALKLATWLVGKFFVFIKKVFGIMLFFRKKKKLSESSIVTKKCWRQHFREKRLLFTHLASHLSACKICTGVRGEKNIRCESILPMYLFYPWKKGWRSSFEGFKHCTAKKNFFFFKLWPWCHECKPYKPEPEASSKTYWHSICFMKIFPHISFFFLFFVVNVSHCEENMRYT